MRFFIVALAFIGFAAAACDESQALEEYNCKCVDDQLLCDSSSGLNFFAGASS
ncbi:hypothetical protein DM02DRAFT_614849 [Periconia macrospinosa]|uniref:Extracellular membrane protein CFEM domain-containing protein n=1 Tax=Periconia macrospinosa TaxID=97972 RepID=A0A2V1DR73_9PLEO|nr:hypothetical protein DM02DRAFT_614849 [Periconia macrospinosa]